MKDTESRRREIIKLLKQSNKPISGSFLASKFNVSRQAIVQDIAILRARGFNILSTNTGYYFRNANASRLFKVKHNSGDTIEELNLIVDLGGVVEDVIVKHETYGDIKAQLNLKSRRDISRLIKDLKFNEASYLKNLTDDFHFHTVSAESEEILGEIEDELYNRGFLIK